MTKWYTVCLSSRTNLNFHVKFTFYVCDDLCFAITVSVSVDLVFLITICWLLIATAMESIACESIDKCLTCIFGRVYWSWKGQLVYLQCFLLAIWTNHFGRVCWSFKQFSNCEGKCLVCLWLATSFLGSGLLEAGLIPSSSSLAFLEVLVAWWSSLPLLLWLPWGGCTSWQTVPPPRASTLYGPVVLLATVVTCRAPSKAISVVVWVSTFATSLLGRAFLKRLRQSTGLKQWIWIVTGAAQVSLLIHLILLAGPLMGLGHFNHEVIAELLWFCIVDILPYLKV